MHVEPRDGGRRLGRLAPGRQADISVLDVRPGDWMVYDVLGAGLRVDRAVVPFVTVKKGRVFTPDWGPRAWGWEPDRALPAGGPFAAGAAEGSGSTMPILPEWSSLGLFAVAALVLLLTPGPAVLYIVTRSIDQGWRAGLVSVLGVHVGTLAHIFAAAAGLSALLAASATAFGVVKYLGAVYLIYIGVRRLRDRESRMIREGGAPTRLRRAFVDGVVVNVLNPKTGLFFLAFLPQFVTEARGHVGEQIVALGVVFVLLGAVTDSLYALTAGSAARWLRGQPRFLAGERWVTGGLYISLGLAAALSSTHRK